MFDQIVFWRFKVVIEKKIKLKKIFKSNSILVLIVLILFSLINISQAQDEEQNAPPKQLNCDYGSGSETNLCNFEINEENQNVKWKLGTGITAFWLGGPLKDRSIMENNGGYLYLDTSYKNVNKIFPTAALHGDETSLLRLESNVQPTIVYGKINTSNNLKSFSPYDYPHSFYNKQNDYSSNPRKQNSNHLFYERKFMQDILNQSMNPLFNSNLLNENSFLIEKMLPLNSSLYFDSSINKNHGSLGLKNNAIYKPLIAFSDIVQTHYELPVPNSGSILSPNISATGPMGNCLRFYYNMDGLSANKLRILVLDYASEKNQTLWETTRQTDGEWIRVEISYAFDKLHKIILEGVTKPFDSPERTYRGYIAVDDFSYSFLGDEFISSGMCHGHCTFEGGLCGWTNLAEEDDFDWSQGRGSDNFYTGPSRDYYSFAREFQLGGYLFIDASYPRRPGDKALLRSPQFPAPIVDSSKNAELEKQENFGPICFKFATHMFGNGIGTLRVKVRSSEENSDSTGTNENQNNEKVLWEITGEAGNNWYLAQLTYASTTSYYFIFEGIIGPNYLGNIAIDNIIIEQGACPISPQTASHKSGDCTFEESMCAWTNANNALGLDHFDWTRHFSYGSFIPKSDNTKTSSKGYFMSLNNENSFQKGGSYAWLVSSQFRINKKKNNIGKCMNFYYFMYQRIIEPSGPSLGGLRVHVRTFDNKGKIVLLPIWRLNNHQSMRWSRAQVLIRNDMFSTSSEAIYQIVLEGVWGDARVGSIAVDDITFFDVAEDDTLCKILPKNADSVKGECSFDRNFCDWKNNTLQINGNDVNAFSSSEDLSLMNEKSSSLISHKISATYGGVAGSTLNTNKNSQFLGLNVKRFVGWRLATGNSRPSNLQDHTFRAPVGYLYFDVFNQQLTQHPILKSPKFPAITSDDSPKSRCLSFWFSAFGRGDNSILSVYLVKLEESNESRDEDNNPSNLNNSEKKEENSGNEKTNNKMLLWSIESKLLETRRNLWYYAQTNINAEANHQILFQGEAADGGFAIDDITFYNGTCTTRPNEAIIKMKTKES